MICGGNVGAESTKEGINHPMATLRLPIAVVVSPSLFLQLVTWQFCPHCHSRVDKCAQISSFRQLQFEFR